MKLSNMITALQKAMEQYGDKEIGTWLDSGEDTQYPVRLKKIGFQKIPGNEIEDWSLPESESETLWINFGKYNEDNDSLYVID